MTISFLLFLVLLSCSLPATAHEGTTGQHLILGLDMGICFGIFIGFVAGVACTTLFLKRSNRS